MSFKSYNIVIAAANKLAKYYAKKFISTTLVPIDYTRTKEIPAILDVSGILNMKNKKLRILDIGSPQILSLCLCLYSELWNVVYINPFEMELEDLHIKSSVLSLKNLDVRYGNITDLSTISNIGQFDYIFSCSVFEHIHPENGGDIIASKNATQLLKPEGIFSFSVPYYKKGFSEYKYGDVYAEKATSGKRTFFQRFYDKESLNNQIIQPTDLIVLEEKYIGEKYYFENNIHKRMAFLVGVGKRRLLFGRFFKNISDFFMEESMSSTSLKKPYLAILALKKNL
jgi:SAM-dependent methyltransferase